MTVIERWTWLPEPVRMWSPWWLRHVLAVERDSHNRTMQELREAEAAQPRGAVAAERARIIERIRHIAAGHQSPEDPWGAALRHMADLLDAGA